MNASDLNPLGTAARVVLLAITVVAVIAYLVLGEEPLALPGIIVVGVLIGWFTDRLNRWVTRDR